MKTINDLISQFKESLHINIYLNDSKPNYKKAIPLAIKSKYDIFSVKIENIDTVILVSKEDIKSIKKHLEIFQRFIDLPIILAYDKINSSNKNYLIENGISFVSKDTIYLPQLLIYLDNISKKQKTTKNKKLSKLAQTILISSLIQRKYNDKVYEMDIESSSHLWGVTKMSSSRALKELVDFNYLSYELLGRKKYYFLKDSIDFEKFLTDLKNPVINSVYIKSKDLIYFEIKAESSYAALSKYTNITNIKPIYAIEKTYFDKIIKKDNEITIYDEEYDDTLIQVELYRYSPFLDFEDEIKVDSISLYLSLKDKIDIEDSRMLEAMNELKYKIEELL